MGGITGIRAIIVDDEICIRTTLTMLLEEIGCRVTTAANGIDAIEIISENSEMGRFFDLVIADTHMPEMGGIELIKWVRTFHKNTKTILLSGIGKDELAEELKDMTDTGFLKKPFSYRKLLSMIEAYAGSAQKSSM